MSAEADTVARQYSAAQGRFIVNQLLRKQVPCKPFAP